MSVTECAGFIFVDLKVAGKLMGVPISERSVLYQAWPECHEKELVKEDVELVIHVSVCMCVCARMCVCVCA